MKTVVWMCCLAMLATQAGQAQKKPSSTRAHDTVRQQPPKTKMALGVTISLVSDAAYGAKAPAAENRLTISDPVVQALNLRSSGIPTNVDVAALMGGPPATFGVAGGKLLLKNTTAPGSGGITGSGSVGTGTAIGSMGTGGNSLGVNGKSPDAGPAINGVPLYGTILRRERQQPKQ